MMRAAAEADICVEIRLKRLRSMGAATRTQTFSSPRREGRTGQVADRAVGAGRAVGAENEPVRFPRNARDFVAPW